MISSIFRDDESPKLRDFLDRFREEFVLEDSSDVNSTSDLLIGIVTADPRLVARETTLLLLTASSSDWSLTFSWDPENERCISSGLLFFAQLTYITQI